MFHKTRRLPGRSRIASILGVVLVMGLVISQVAPATQPVRAVPVMESANHSEFWTDEAASTTDAGGGLQLELSEGVEQQGPVEQVPVAPSEPLSADRTQQILDRLPPLAFEAEDVADFRLPPELLPPPRPGMTVDQPFPPSEDAAAPPSDEAGPLEVLRYAPEGEIPLAPFLNVTFSQPMVPLATLEQLAALDVPVKLTPAVPGVWKWIGTKTLSFEYSGETGERFPMATEYVAEIAAGIESATGGVLAESVRWTFTTPPPQLTNWAPGYGPQPRDPLLFAAFNQRIDPASVLKTVQVSAGGRIYPVRLATEQEVADDATIRKLAERAGRELDWLAFRAESLFPADTTVAVNFGPGTPSAEGPLTTPSVQSFSFQTYAALRIDAYHCGYNYAYTDCPPLTPFEIVFNNTIDAEYFDESLISVEPAIPGLVIENFGTTIRLSGVTAGRTEYTVTVDGDIRDMFGQTLGKDHTLTFVTGSAPQSLIGPNSSFITLDPSADKPVFTFYSVNYERLRVQAYAVTPQDWPVYMAYLQEFNYTERPPEPPGQKVMSKVFTVQGDDDVLTETAIDLSSALGGKTGHLIVVVDRPTFALFGRRVQRDIIQTWVQVTQIGLDAFIDHSEMTAWATSLAGGEPLPDVQVELGGSSATTDADGLAKFTLTGQPASLLSARAGDDVAFLPQSQYYWYEDGWRRLSVLDEVRWHVFDDRAMYRPGEEVRIKGWVRRIGAKQDGDVALLRGANSIRYQVFDPVGNQLADDVSDVNDLGGFDFAVSLPDNANLGYAQVYIQVTGAGNVSGAETYHNFQIQEFRRPEFEVTARPEGEGPYFVGGEAMVGVHAAYFAGGPLPNAGATWNVTAQPGSYSPPNWPDFTFGTWTPWWRYYGGDGGASQTQLSYEGVTDASGAHILRIAFPSASKPQPYSIRAQAVVMDVNRQGWASSANLLVHPADLYVGLRSARTFVEAHPGGSRPLVIDAIVTDLDGNPVSDRPIAMRAVRLEWKYENGDWRENEADAQECTAGSLAEPVSCTFTTEFGGEYRITASVQDSMGRENRSEFTRWVSGAPRGFPRPPARNVEQEEVQLIPDKQFYQPGDVAEILVQAPFVPADGLLSLRRNGIVSTERFHMNEPTTVLRVPIEDAYIPNLHVVVDLTGAAARVDDQGNPQPDLPSRPAYAVGSLNLSIPPLSRELALTVEPAQKELEPGARTSLKVAVADAGGAPVANAELAVVIVDEAILALTGYTMADPLATFYQDRPDGVSSYYGRSNIVLINPADLASQLQSKMDEAMAEMAPMPTMAAAMPAAEGGMMAEADMARRGLGGGPAEQEAASPIIVRTDFNPLAVFAPAVRSDENGQATVDVKLPDNLTRYRVMVTAVAGEKLFGSAESNITARLPLMVRPAAPRFLNFGDRFELPIVVQNQTDEPLQVEVAVRAANIDLTESAGQLVEIPANDRREVRFPAATLNAGTARLQIAAVSGSLADAASAELPVYTPATTEAFATYGVVDEGAIVQPILSPANVFPQFGGLEVNTSSTALQALTDAVIYLVNYPFECSEQIASRILGLAALRDVLTAFQAEGLPSPEEMAASVERDIARLQQFQNDDGGFPVWTRGRESIPYHSIHAAHALQRAREMDYAVPDEMLQRALDYLRNIEGYYPSWYGQQTRHALSAYALYVRNLLGDVDAPKARNLLNSYPLDDQSLEAIAWLWQVLSDDPASAAEVESIRRHINNRAVETAGAANFITSYGDDAYLMLHSDRRTDAVVLDALINDSPDSDLIPKVVAGLLAHREAGRWNNTQENVFVLLALDRYFNTYEAVTPDFVARMWLGETYVASHEYQGRTTERQATTIPMSYLTEGAEEGSLLDLILEKEGAGRLYYRLGLRYAPEDLDLKPLDMGFTVQRTYAAVDDPEDVRRDEDGVWRIKAGARVRITIDMVANTRRYHVALVDPLPAGLESINPALAVSESIPGDVAEARPDRWWWWGPWYEHQNLRDSRAEAFASLLWEGVYQYSYVARATTPGSFVAPPAKAEEMYSPEVFGRSATDRVIVE